MEDSRSARIPFDMAAAKFGRLMREAAGPLGTDCVPEPVQREIARQVLEETGWTVKELLERVSRVAEAGPAIVPVTRHTDVASLARRMADHSRQGGQVVLYQAGFS